MNNSGGANNHTSRWLLGYLALHKFWLHVTSKSILYLNTGTGAYLFSIYIWLIRMGERYTCGNVWYTCSWGWINCIPGSWRGNWVECKYKAEAEWFPTWLGLNGAVIIASEGTYPIPVGVVDVTHGPGRCWGSGLGWCSEGIEGLGAEPSCGNSVL